MKTGDDHMEGFAMRLTQLRKKKGYTQAQLADKIGVTNKSVSRWERGEGYPDISVLPALADALSVSIDALLNEKERQSIPKQMNQTSMYLYIAILIGYLLLGNNPLYIVLLGCYIGYSVHLYRQKEYNFLKLQFIGNVIVIFDVIVRSVVMIASHGLFMFSSFSIILMNIQLMAFGKNDVSDLLKLAIMVCVALAIGVGISYLIDRKVKGDMKK